MERVSFSEMFITFEGPEGSGKSSCIRWLVGRLEAKGRAVLSTREPGAGDFGRQIRALLLEGEAMPPLSELFLFLADRAHHVDRIIRPALERGEIVLCDRHADSTVVYQGARGLDTTMLRHLNHLATNGLKPNLTLLFDIEPSIGLARIQDKDRMDREPIEFHQAVRQGFLDEAQLDPERWQVIRAEQNFEQVCAEAWTIVKDCLS